MNQRLAVYPGTFDPIHCGHQDIARRAALLFDRLVVTVYERPNKTLLFSAQERLALVREVLQDVPNIEVCLYSGLTVAFAESIGAQALVRGLRVISDFELEYQMALTNHQLAPEIETVCLMTHERYAFLSASIVKEIFMSGGDVTAMVPPPVYRALLSKKELLRSQDPPVAVVSLRD